MNAFPAVLAFASMAAVAAPPDRREAQQPPPDLRRTVQQYDGRMGAPMRRELSQDERAQLRRQLSDFAQPRAERHR